MPHSNGRSRSAPSSYAPNAAETKTCGARWKRCWHKSQSPRGFETSIAAAAANIMEPRVASLSGRRLGPFDVGPLLGRGGMGEVYQAFDSQLGRSVALPDLPEAVASDPGRLSRFRREAHLLASLNHPNVAAIYGVEETEGVPALVLELVDGPTLADRLAHGPIPHDEASPIARRSPPVLEAAHERGIVHRDLKPANVNQPTAP